MRRTFDNRKLVPVPVGKGCVLYMTAAEYAAAVARGKAISRRRQFVKRSQPNPPPSCGTKPEPFRQEGRDT
jgi:hypothetical protein